VLVPSGASLGARRPAATLFHPRPAMRYSLVLCTTAATAVKNLPAERPEIAASRVPAQVAVQVAKKQSQIQDRQGAAGHPAAREIFPPQFIKMDIEGAEGLVFKKSNFLTRVNQISMELHGLENINVVNNVLNSSGFKVQRYGVTDELNSTLKNILKHPVDFLMNERKSGYIAIKGVNSIIKHKRNPVPSLSENEFELITAKRIY
jgi:hypothetical protein